MEAPNFLTAGYMTHKSKIFRPNIQEKENQPSINLVTLLSRCISNRLVSAEGNVSRSWDSF